MWDSSPLYILRRYITKHGQFSELASVEVSPYTVVGVSISLASDPLAYNRVCDSDGDGRTAVNLRTRTAKLLGVRRRLMV